MLYNINWIMLPIKGVQMITVRYETFDDIPSVAFVHAQTWNSTYPGIISDTYLKKIIDNQENRIIKRQETFYDGKISQNIVADEDGQVIGFSSYGPSREHMDKDEKVAEIYALYVLKEKQGMGVGNQLVKFALEDIIENEYDTLRIWALKENKYRQYYESLGGVDVEEKVITIDDHNHLEVCYQYDHLKDLFLKLQSRNKMKGNV